MAKQINFLLIAQGLTGDGNVYFYATPELAEQAFKNLTQPLTDICINNYYDTDKHDVFETFQDDKAMRFNSGILDALDILIGGSNIYYQWGTVTVDDHVTHYIAEFNEWLDESKITFHNAEQAKIKYNDAIDEGISIAASHHHIHINRYDQSTWEHEGNTVYSEPINTKLNHTDVFFGYSSDAFYTIRCGSIDVMDIKKYHIIAKGGYLKKPKIYEYEIDPTDPDTLKLLADSESYEELIDYLLEEEDAEWDQRHASCQIFTPEEWEELNQQ